MAGDLKFSIKIEDNSKLVLEAEEKAIEDALYAMGIKAVEGATDAISGKKSIDPAVDTGRLRASISFITPTFESGQTNKQTPKAGSKAERNPLRQGDLLSGSADKNSVIVGSNVEYAQQVHNGMWTSEKGGENRKYKVRPFLRVGIEQTKGEMERQVTTILKGGTI